MTLTQLRRTLDPRFLNEVANDPDVRPQLGGKGDLDLSATIGNPANFAFEGEHGGFVVVQLETGAYEVHSMFRPAGRGAAVVEAVTEAMRFMFTQTDCMELQTKVPDCNKAAGDLARRVGFVETFRRENAWADADGLSGVSYQVITFNQWKARDPLIAAIGHFFHQALETAKAATGSALATHDDDDAHDRAVGAAMLMAQAGNAAKGVWTYNRWARLAGYQPIVLVSQNPAVIDVIDAVVSPKGDGMEVLLCR